MEDQPLVSYTAGSMNSLVAKLENPHFAIQGLKEALVTLHKDFFQVLAGQLQRNCQVEAWMKQVRELVFDIEDWIDQKPDMGGQELEIEYQIKSFEARVKHTRELCQRYNLLGEDATGIHDPVVDSQPFPEDKTGLLGVKDQSSELVKLLESGQKMVKVVSIVGMEGLGKTTLAKQIYTRLQGNFDCHAFVSVGRRPLSMRAILGDILHQVKSSHKNKVKPKTNINHRDGSGEAEYLRQVITDLSEFLCKKRYFIVVDGLWSKRVWKKINCALPNKNRRSRVLITTCISDVATCCSVRPTDVYMMEALGERMSQSLYQKIREEKMPRIYDEAANNNMLKVCGGMPLAIIVTAGLLATEPAMFGNHVSLSSLEHCFTSEGMTKILQMSYAALSLPLKSCFLYLSVFREDCTIKKDRLIRLWVAEGLIPSSRKHKGKKDKEITEKEEEERGDEYNLWETGERYFNELVMRRLIQPVFHYDDYQAVSCTIHSVILGFIQKLSSKGNFVTASADLSPGGSAATVRRLALDCYNGEDEDGDRSTLASIAVHLCRVRSMSILGDIEQRDGRSALTASGKIGGISVLPSLRLLRVLDLEDTNHLNSQHLQGIRGLVLLRYLGVAGTAIDELPEEIGELELLETLDLRGTKLITLPASIVELKRLAHLLIDCTVKLPGKIWKMQALEEVSTIGVGSCISVDSVVKLLMSDCLRVLGIRLDELDVSCVKRIACEVAKSTKLTSLSLSLPPVCYDLGVDSYIMLCNQLRRFELKISGPIPSWEAGIMCYSDCVTNMDVEVVQLEDRFVRVLGKLPKLMLLKLVSKGIFNPQFKKRPNRCTIGVDHGFNCLKVLSFISQSGGAELQFTPGAMKEIQRLSLGFSARETLLLFGNFSFGIEHLSSLTRVDATINCRSATASEVKSAEDAIREQVDKVYRKPTIQVTTTHKKDRWPDHKAKATASPENRAFISALWETWTTRNDHISKYKRASHFRYKENVKVDLDFILRALGKKP